MRVDTSNELSWEVQEIYLVYMYIKRNENAQSQRGDETRVSPMVKTRMSGSAVLSLR